VVVATKRRGRKRRKASAVRRELKRLRVVPAAGGGFAVVGRRVVFGTWESTRKAERVRRAIARFRTLDYHALMQRA